MSYLLGIDTGGTFTDAVIVDDNDPARPVIAAAKALTTHHDLIRGVSGAIDAVLAAGPGVTAGDISLVSVSTTLATNALVEGHGESAGLVTLGFAESELSRIGLDATVEPGLRLVLDGGHDAHGFERTPVDVDALRDAVLAVDADVSAWAVTGQFSVRNSAHEELARSIIVEATGKPVSCSHELSARLDGPRRALTAVLNARLIGRIARLNDAVNSALGAAGIDAPLMVVRGDGSLVSDRFAAERPIETVLSGPAASVIGAAHLTTIADGLVADIGGTTTDVAVIVDGQPQVGADGAVVGGHRTMIEAVDMATIGLGGDSEVLIDTRHQDGPIVIGPARAMPLGRLATMYPETLRELRSQHADALSLSTHGRFLVSDVTPDAAGDDRERAVLERLANGPATEDAVARLSLAARAVARLRAKGLVRIATFTPTDALAVLDPASAIDGMDVEASTMGAEIIARKTSANGGQIALDGPTLAQQVMDLFVHRSARFVLATALAADGLSVDDRDPLIEAALGSRGSAARIDVGVAEPIAAIGASAHVWYPSIASLLGTSADVPHHHGVANAIGAVVGQVRVRRSVTITQPTKGQFKVHVDDQPAFGSVERAHDAALQWLEAEVRREADKAGATTAELTSSFDQRTAIVGAKEVFVEGTVTVTGQGRPRF